MQLCGAVPQCHCGEADEVDHRQDRSEQRNRETNNKLQDIKVPSDTQNIPYVLCDGGQSNVA